MSEERFSASDLEPSDSDKKARRARHIETGAMFLACSAVGLVVGGMLALGACAAPFVFRMTPAPFSGYAMGAAFARFDSIAMGLSCVLLGAEVVRTFLARKVPSRAARVRRVLSIAFAACTVYMGVTISPSINELYKSGARRGEGDDGAKLEQIHGRASLVGRAEAGLGLIIIALHLFGRRLPENEDDDDESALSPMAPGPRR